MYYGQWETDRIIANYFIGRKYGVCIEVGAYDGIKGSNTKFFEDIGWQTICIEPNPDAFEELSANRNGTCLSCACGKKRGRKPLSIYNFESGIQSSLTSLKTDPRLIEDYKSAIDHVIEVDVEVHTLEYILDTFVSAWYDPNDIDFISIDTEGTELDVVQGLGPYRPRMLVIENNYDDFWFEATLKTYGYYRDRRYKVNDFYVRI